VLAVLVVSPKHVPFVHNDAQVGKALGVQFFQQTAHGVAGMYIHVWELEEYLLNLWDQGMVDAIEKMLDDVGLKVGVGVRHLQDPRNVDVRDVHLS
jgi:hypothetical protein